VPDVDLLAVSAGAVAAFVLSGAYYAVPLLLRAGAILHEHTPLKLAAIHGGDWLAKLLVVAAIAGLIQ
jgi:hypothetical protein